MATTKTAPTRKTTASPATEPKFSVRPSTGGQASIQIASGIRSEQAIPEPPAPSPEVREQLIRDAAYFRAERRGFGAGDPVQDWVEAEAELGRKQLGQGAEGR